MGNTCGASSCIAAAAPEHNRDRGGGVDDAGSLPPAVDSGHLTAGAAGSFSTAGAGAGSISAPAAATHDDDDSGVNPHRSASAVSADAAGSQYRSLGSGTQEFREEAEEEEDAEQNRSPPLVVSMTPFQGATATSGGLDEIALASGPQPLPPPSLESESSLGSFESTPNSEPQMNGATTNNLVHSIGNNGNGLRHLMVRGSTSSTPTNTQSDGMNSDRRRRSNSVSSGRMDNASNKLNSGSSSQHLQLPPLSPGSVDGQNSHSDAVAAPALRHHHHPHAVFLDSAHQEMEEEQRVNLKRADEGESLRSMQEQILQRQQFVREPKILSDDDETHRIRDVMNSASDSARGVGPIKNVRKRIDDEDRSWELVLQKRTSNVSNDGMHSNNTGDDDPNQSISMNPSCTSASGFSPYGGRETALILYRPDEETLVSAAKTANPFEFHMERLQQQRQVQLAQRQRQATEQQRMKRDQIHERAITTTAQSPSSPLPGAATAARSRETGLVVVINPDDTAELDKNSNDNMQHQLELQQQQQQHSRRRLGDRVDSLRSSHHRLPQSGRSVDTPASESTAFLPSEHLLSPRAGGLSLRISSLSPGVNGGSLRTSGSTPASMTNIETCDIMTGTTATSATTAATTTPTGQPRPPPREGANKSNNNVDDCVISNFFVGDAEQQAQRQQHESILRRTSSSTIINDDSVLRSHEQDQARRRMLGKVNCVSAESLEGADVSFLSSPSASFGDSDSAGLSGPARGGRRPRVHTAKVPTDDESVTFSSNLMNPESGAVSPASQPQGAATFPHSATSHLEHVAEQTNNNNNNNNNNNINSRVRGVSATTSVSGDSDVLPRAARMQSMTEQEQYQSQNQPFVRMPLAPLDLGNE